MKITATAVVDDAPPPVVGISVDARGLSCVGETSGAPSAKTGQTNLTRSFAAADVIETTEADKTIKTWAELT